MYDYGKLTMRKEAVEIDGVPFDIGVFYNVHDVEWHEVFTSHPSNWYVAITDDNIVISAEQNPEHSQIAGCTILGLDDLSGFERVSSTVSENSVYGKFWNGSAIVMPSPTRSELFPPLAKWRFEAMLDIHGQQTDEDLRGMIDEAVEALPEPHRTIAKSKRQNVQDYYRDDPLFDFIGNAVNKTSEQVDILWNSAHAL